MPLKTYRDLIAWRRAMSLIETVYAITTRARKRGDRALSGQLERAAISIAANIAEGYGRSGRGEYLQFLGIASGSLREVETLLLIGERVKSAPTESISVALEKCDETGRVLFGLIRSLRKTRKEKGSGMSSRTLTPNPEP